MLGTRLDVSEDMEAPDPEDPTAPEYALYELLGQLQYLMIEVLAAGPDEGGPKAAEAGHLDGPWRGSRRRLSIPLLISKRPDRVWSPHRLAA